MKSLACFSIAAAIAGSPIAAAAQDAQPPAPSLSDTSPITAADTLEVVDRDGHIVGVFIPVGTNAASLHLAPHALPQPRSNDAAMPRICPPRGYTLDVAWAIEWSTSSDLVTPLSDCAP